MPTPLRSFSVAPSVAVLLVGYGLAGCNQGEDLAAPVSGGEPPDTIVLVTIDTLRADHLPSYGYPRDTAPFLTALAERSAWFESCISASATTAPSHASIFTSLQPMQHGLLRNGLHLDERVPTLAESMAAKGYRTAAFTSVGFLRGVSRGFERFETRRKDDADAKETTLTIRSYLPAEVVVDRASEWVGRLESGAPAFLWVHLYDVHQWQSDDDVPPEALAELRRRDARGEGGAASSGRLVMERHAAAPSELRWTEAELESYIDNYDAQIVHVDEQLERLHDALERFGRGGNALWVITSDHGEGLASHGYESHGELLYQEQLHVPLVLHFTDGRYAGERREELVRSVDLFATVEELVGQGISPHARGRSIVPLLTAARAAEPGRLAYAERRPVDANKARIGWTDESLHSVQSRRHKYIAHGASRDEFYDLRDDPLELENLIDRPSTAKDDLSLRIESHLRMISREDRAEEELDPAFTEELEQLGYIK